LQSQSQVSGWPEKTLLGTSKTKTHMDTKSINWALVKNSLDEKGHAVIPGLLSGQECQSLSGLYCDPTLYRNVINMKRYRFGEGEYKYFNYPLPSAVQTLRQELYSPLSEIANAWMSQLSIETRFPEKHSELLNQCKVHNQERPTPLILRYTTGGYNTLHQDLYGQIYFPFQVVLMLSQKGVNYDGGEFVLTEQVPRAQSKATVLTPDQGDAIIFTTNFRPVKGSRGYYRANMKHGISEVKSGERYALGIIFHDAT
jgi:uncharacterized protein